MRKVILQMTTSIDGYVAKPDGELDWIFEHSTEETRNYVSELLNSSDSILLGRGMSKEFLDYWPKYESEFAKRINSLPKIVFSKTVKEMPYPDVKISDDIVEEIRKQKSLPGKNLILYGGCGLATSFAKLGVIDEYHLLTVPVILGSGMHLFEGVPPEVLKLVNSQTTSAGVTINRYEPKKQK